MDLIEFLNARLGEDEARGLEHAEQMSSAGPEWAAHAQQTIDRWFREVEAKRVILALHRPEPMRYIEANRCPRCRGPWPCDEVRIIAGIYSSHPDYPLQSAADS